MREYTEVDLLSILESRGRRYTMAVACMAGGEIEKCPRVAMAHSAKLIEAVGKHPKFKERVCNVFIKY